MATFSSQDNPPMAPAAAPSQVLHVSASAHAARRPVFDMNVMLVIISQTLFVQIASAAEISVGCTVPNPTFTVRPRSLEVQPRT